MKFVIFVLFIVFIVFKQADCSVLGIDLGSEYYKISMIAPGKSFLIMENTFSKRKTHTSVAFVNEERLYESDALLKKSRFPANTLIFMKKFITALENKQSVIELSNKYYEDYYSYIEEEKGTFAFKIPNFSGEDFFIVSIEEVLGMILYHGKVLAEHQLGTSVKNCVFTIPSSWNLHQREILYSSAKLADLYPLTFIHENTAVALNYAFDRQDVNETHNVLFYNMGSSSTKINLVEFTAVNVSGRNIENLRVLGEIETDLVSGREFDYKLADLLVEHFDKLPQRKGKQSLKQNKPAFRRLLSEANKFKEVLSANREAPFFVESILDDIDFKVLIDRNAFESRCEELLSKLTPLIDELLLKTGKTKSDLNGIELFGGNIRIPMIQNKLAEYFEGKEIGQHLNGDEAAANGAVFQAANYSLIYKVRPIWVSDGYNFGIRMGINNKEGDIIEKKDIFGKREDFNNKISVEVNKIEELKLSFSMIYDENKEEYFKTIEITGIPDIKGGNYTNITNVAIILNITLCSMKGVDLKAYLKFEEHLFSEVEKSIYPENFTFPENYTSDDNSTINETLFTKVKEIKESFKRHELKLNTSIWTPNPRGLNEDEMKTSKEKLKALDDKEALKRRTAKAKNDLEAYIYKIADTNSDEIYQLVTNSTQREPLEVLSHENSEWLESDEGYNSNYSVYEHRLEQIKNITNPIYYRMEEYRLRPQAINDSINYLSEFESTVLGLNKTHPWITVKQKMLTLGLILSAQHWLNNTIANQSNLSLTETPVLRVYELSNMLDVVAQNVTRLKNIKPSNEFYKKMAKEFEEKSKKAAKENATEEEIQSELKKSMENLEKDDQIDLDSQEIPPNEEKLTDSHTENPETNAHKEDL